MKKNENMFTTAMHKCVSLFWWIFFGTFYSSAERSPLINVHEEMVKQNLGWVMGKTESMEISEN